jgi:hypothetical protein
MLQAPVDNGQHDGRELLCFPHLLYTIVRLAWIELGDAEARALLEEPFLIAAIRVKMFLMIVLFNHSIRPHSFHPRHNIHASLIHCDVVLVIGNVCVALRCVALRCVALRCIDSWFAVCTTDVSKYNSITALFQKICQCHAWIHFGNDSMHKMLALACSKTLVVVLLLLSLLLANGIITLHHARRARIMSSNWSWRPSNVRFMSAAGSYFTFTKLKAETCSTPERIMLYILGISTVRRCRRPGRIVTSSHRGTIIYDLDGTSSKIMSYKFWFQTCVYPTGFNLEFQRGLLFGTVLRFVEKMVKNL